MKILGADYEHTVGLGSANTEIGAVEYEVRPLTQLYKMILEGAPFEVTEFSLSNHIMMRDRGFPDHIAIPVFPSRAFRHSCLYVRRDSPMRSFADLRGRKVGVLDYSMTAAVWLRGIMQDEHGVHWSECRWLSGQSPRFPVPEEVVFESAAGSLEEMLVAGTIDALLTPRLEEEGKAPAERRCRTLIEDACAAERAYYQAHCIYPIMHTVILHRDTVQSRPEAPRVVFDLFVRAKERAVRRRLGASLIPWGAAHWDEVMAMFGGDPLPYGLDANNRHTVEVLARYLHEQRLVSRIWTPEEIFGEYGALGQ